VKSLLDIKSALPPQVTLVAVSKTYPVETVMQAYEAGQRIFGENKVQEMTEKYEQMPKDIQWHLIGHLQTNKVKYIAPFVTLIHSVDSLKLLKEINRQAKKNGRVIDCLLQIYIADEETKFGFDELECRSMLSSEEFREMKNIRIRGLMGMASNTSDENRIRTEFRNLRTFFDSLKKSMQLDILSMGMSGDMKLAIEEGSTMVRIGSSIFGRRA
jgi:pyridoxal phosphate enzyme (YggS family)